ncbi:hypothetical protein HNR23_002045 [Nocardiopsis mwathae]|uniref:DUF4184 family protein n=1 Tax=Nocardiopsis mwathae TaxID=1472723 RepID=A0A7W9YH06_9ACTN|nr:hypothetical protein [Nocardiopsis mwathae]
MPFTLCHAAVAIPMSRDRLLPSALAIGAMSPDFGKFVPVAVPAVLDGLGYQISDLLLGSLLGMAVFVVFQALLKRPLVALAPGWARRRLAGPARGFRWDGRTLGWAALSVFLGAVTHILLDGITHGDVVPWPSTEAVVGGVSRQQVVQDGLSVVLGVAMAVWIVAWMLRAVPVEDEPTVGLPRWWRLPVWSGMALVVGLAVVDAARVPAEAFRLNRWQAEGELVWAKLAMTAVDAAVVLAAAVAVYTVAYTAWQLLAVGLMRRPSPNGSASRPAEQAVPFARGRTVATGPQPRLTGTGPQPHLGMRD